MLALRADGLGDEIDILTDMVEGETSLLDAIDQALGEIDDVEILIVGLKDKKEQLYRRRKLFEQRIVRLRALLERRWR